jgi:hypothetical protein
MRTALTAMPSRCSLAAPLTTLVRRSFRIVGVDQERHILRLRARKRKLQSIEIIEHLRKSGCEQKSCVAAGACEQRIRTWQYGSNQSRSRPAASSARTGRSAAGWEVAQVWRYSQVFMSAPRHRACARVAVATPQAISY